MSLRKYNKIRTIKRDARGEGVMLLQNFQCVLLYRKILLDFVSYI